MRDILQRILMCALERGFSSKRIFIASVACVAGGMLRSGKRRFEILDFLAAHTAHAGSAAKTLKYHHLRSLKLPRPVFCLKMLVATKCKGDFKTADSKSNYFISSRFFSVISTSKKLSFRQKVELKSLK